MSRNTDPQTILVFRLDARHYAFPLPEVERVLPMVAIAPLLQAPAVIVGVIDIQGLVVPVVDLRRRMGLEGGPLAADSRLITVRTPRRVFAVVADEVLDLREVPDTETQPADTIAPGLSPVSGIAVTENGLILICDLDAFLSLDEEQQLNSALKSIV